jgi:hypothetical protein
MVFADSELSIALDTSRVERISASTYGVWLQTRWTAPRHGNRKRTASPFNREVIQTYLQCSPVAYRVIRTVVSLNDGPPVDSIVVGDRAAWAAAWAIAKPHSADIGAGDRACAILSHARPKPL